ncbi:MAG: Zn-ribbon domain-containing OB-fold protein [Pseudomonadota bacterium]
MLKLDKKGYPILEAEAIIPYESAFGPTWHGFFEGFKEEKIFGTRCSKCNRVLVPARSFCPRCFVDMEEWVEVSNEGEVVAWALTDYEYFGMPTKPPFVSALIKLDGTDCSFLHLIGGFDLRDLETVRKTIKNGMKVRAVWEKEKKGQIMDIKYFEPV